MNRRDFCKITGGVAACSLLQISLPALATPAPKPTELSRLLDSLPWDRPQLIFISGAYASFEKHLLANEIGKRIHRLHRGYVIDGCAWASDDWDCNSIFGVAAYKCDDRQALRLAKECVENNSTTICLPLHLTLGMKYMASLIFEVGYGTQENVPSVATLARLTKNRWTPEVGTIVKLGTSQFIICNEQA